MRISILPVFDESDLAAVPNALEFFRRVGLETLLILHNPSLGLKGAMTEQYDARIRELKAEMGKAASREDFPAATEYKARLEEAQTDKDLAIRDGWSKVPQPERDSVYRRIFGAVGTEAVICLNESMRKEQLFQALNGLLEVWPKDIPHGEFSVVWPQSIPKQEALSVAATSVGSHRFLKHEDRQESPLPPSGEYKFEAKPKKKLMRLSKGSKNTFNETTVDGRKSALERFHAKVLGAVAKYGLDGTQPKDVLIGLILEREFGAKAA